MLPLYSTTYNMCKSIPLLYIICCAWCLSLYFIIFYPQPPRSVIGHVKVLLMVF